MGVARVLEGGVVADTTVRGGPGWVMEKQPVVRWRVAEPLEAQSRPARISYEEFLAWADEDTLAEWVDGEVVMYSPASNKHQDIADFLVSVLRPFVEAHTLGAVRSAPFQMKLARSGREPDLIFVAREHLERLRETYLDGPADVAVEVTSRESMQRDRVGKYYEYQANGVQEYWLIDPSHEQAEFYRLGDDGKYETVLAGREGVFRSEVIPGFWLEVEWLWQSTLPDIEDTLWEITGHDEAVSKMMQVVGREDVLEQAMQAVDDETVVERLVQVKGEEIVVRQLVRAIGAEAVRRLMEESDG